MGESDHGAMVRFYEKLAKIEVRRPDEKPAKSGN
jgi:hypothetical protein